MDPVPASPPLVEYDDRRVEVTSDLIFGAPHVVTAGGLITVTNDSSGTRYGAGLSVAGVPGIDGGLRAGPTVRVGGLSFGLFASGLLDRNPSFAPQVGIGGVTISSNMGLCAGFWCVGPAGAQFLSPPAMAIIGGSQVIRDIAETEREDAESLPLVIASDLLNNVIPVVPIREALNTLGIGTRSGPRVGRIETVESLVSFRSSIERMISGNSHTDALARLNEALLVPQNHFVAAELRELRDKALFEENTRGIPSDAIEETIEWAVEATEEFTQRYQGWLQSGEGPTPSEGELNSYLANSLYLARKLQFLVETVEEDGHTVLKIRRSSPFQIDDPDLAIRYAEAVAFLYMTLSNPSSGLLRELNGRTESLSHSLIDTIVNHPTDRGRIPRADARLTWHVAWIQTVSLLYEQGYFHRRLQHIRWIVHDEGPASEEPTRLARLDQIRYPDIGSLRELLQRATVSTELTTERYLVIKVGLDALRAIGELAHESFPGWLGDGSLLFDRERARGWARRREIIDGLYQLAAIHKALLDPSLRNRPERRWLGILGRESERRLVALMQANPAEVSREWFRYWAGFPNSLRHHIARRLEEAAEALDDFTPGSRGLAAQKRQLQEQLRDLAGEALEFQTGHFGSFERLFEVESQDSAKINGVTATFQRLLGTSPSNKHLQEVAVLLQRVRENYDRFNTRRVGRLFMSHYVRLAQVDPYDIPDSPF